MKLKWPLIAESNRYSVNTKTKKKNNHQSWSRRSQSPKSPARCRASITIHASAKTLQLSALGACMHLMPVRTHPLPESSTHYSRTTLYLLLYILSFLSSRVTHRVHRQPHTLPSLFFIYPSILLGHGARGVHAKARGCACAITVKTAADPACVKRTTSRPLSLSFPPFILSLVVVVV